MKKIKYSKFVVVLSAVAIIMILGITARGYAVSNNITQEELQNPAQNKESIGRRVLNDTGAIEKYPDDEIQDVSVYYGNVANDEEKEAVIVVKVTPKNTVVAVYSPKDGEYEYLGQIGEFYDVKNVEFMPIDSIKRSLPLITEQSNQNLGAYENSKYIRGFNYIDGTFRRVLNIPESIIANWNYLWDNTDAQNENAQSNWNRITQTSDVKYTDGKNPSISLTQYQRHLVSSDKENKNVPPDDTYSVVSERVVPETFYWSDEWGSFILREMKENTSGEKVAVTEDLGSSAYALLEDYGDNKDKVRILRKDGTSDIVYRNTLSELTGESAAA